MPETFHPKHAFRSLGLHLVFRSLAVVAGGIFLFLGVLFTAIALAAMGSPDADGAGLAIALAVGVVFTTAGALLAAHGVRNARALHRLRETGVRATATVTGLRPTALSVNGRRYYAIQFTFRDSSGQSREASSGPLAPDETRGVGEGDEGQVAYDPANTARAIWLGRGL